MLPAVLFDVPCVVRLSEPRPALWLGDHLDWLSLAGVLLALLGLCRLGSAVAGTVVFRDSRFTEVGFNTLW